MSPRNKRILLVILFAVVCSIFLLWLLPRPATVLPPKAPSVAPPPADNVPAWVAAADTPEALAREILARVADVDDEKLDELVASPDCTTAFAAAWEQVRRTNVPTDPTVGGPLDGPAITRFLEFLEGRLRVAAPEVWKKAFAMVHWVMTYYDHERHRSESVGFLPYSVPEVLSTSRIPGPAPGMVVKQDGDDVTIKYQGKRWRIRAEADAWYDAGVFLPDGETLYAALYGEWPGPYDLYALDEHGAIVWSNKVWPLDWLIYCPTIRPHMVELATNADSVVVFGVGDLMAYIDVFEKKTGRSRSRFCTAYLEPLE